MYPLFDMAFDFNLQNSLPYFAYLTLPCSVVFDPTCILLCGFWPYLAMLYLTLSS